MNNKVKTIVLKLSENTMKKMEEYFEDKKRDKTPPYAIFQADEADTVVTLYQSGKAMFQGISADIDANIWAETEKNLNPLSKVSLDKKEKKEVKEKKEEVMVNNAYAIGSDEVGTGDFFGPIVVTASFVKPEDIPFLEELGIKDSKKMTDEYILKVVPMIIKRIDYTSFMLTNKEYNEKYTSGLNLNKIKALLHNKVLLNQVSKHADHIMIVVDQFCSPYNYFEYLSECSQVQKNITFITKAEDKCLAVACSSVISRFIFIKEMDKISLNLNVNLPKGASPKVDEVGCELVLKYGFDVLSDIAKLNFKNTEKIMELLSLNDGH